MSNGENSDIEALKSELQKQKDQALLERITSIEDSVRNVQNSLETSNEQVQTLQSDISVVRQVVEKTDHKVPALQATSVVVLVALGLLGWQVKDIIAAREQITNLGEPVSEAVQALKTSNQAISEASEKVESALTNLERSSKKSEGILQEYNVQITDSLSSISGFERKLAKLSTQLSLLIEEVSRQKGNLADSGGGDTEPASILELFAAQIDDSSDPIAVLTKAAVALEQRDFENARRLAVRAKASYAGPPEAVFDIVIAQSYHGQGKYREAVGAYESAREDTPGDEILSILSNIGVTYFAWAMSIEENEDERIELLEKAAAIEGDARKLATTEATVFVNSAVTLIELGRYSDALTALSEYSGEGHAEIQLALAYTNALMNRSVFALDHLSSALKMDRSLAFSAALSDNFINIRDDVSFLEILSTYLPDDIIDDIKKIWE